MFPQLARFDAARGVIEGAPLTERRLSDLRGVFADTAAYDAALSQADPVVYQVYTVEPAEGEGQLHYGLGVLMPGHVGDEYYLTKGHLHAWRPAAEVYLGLRGSGLMLLEDERGADVRLLPLDAGSAVYVPGYTTHRTVNIGDEPLIYIGVYPSQAGHDYGAIAERNFAHVVVQRDGAPALLPRRDFLTTLETT